MKINWHGLKPKVDYGCKKNGCVYAGIDYRHSNGKAPIHNQDNPYAYGQCKYYYPIKTNKMTLDD